MSPHSKKAHSVCSVKLQPCLSRRFLLIIGVCLLMIRPRGMGSPQAHKTGRRLQQLTGAWCWKRKANRQQHEMHSKNFVARIGGLFTALCGDRASNRKRQRISPKVFLLSYWNAGI